MCDQQNSSDSVYPLCMDVSGRPQTVVLVTQTLLLSRQGISSCVVTVITDNTRNKIEMN